MGAWLLKPPGGHPKLLLPPLQPPPQLMGLEEKPPVLPCWWVMGDVVPQLWGVCGVSQHPLGHPTLMCCG